MRGAVSNSAVSNSAFSNSALLSFLLFDMGSLRDEGFHLRGFIFLYDSSLSAVVSKAVLCSRTWREDVELYSIIPSLFSQPSLPYYIRSEHRSATFTRRK